MLCTAIYETLSQKLAMKIGGENRPEWVMARHWERFAQEVKINYPVLKKRLLEFCLKMTGKIDTTYVDFTARYQQNSLVEDIIAATKKSVSRTRQQLSSTKKMTRMIRRCV